MRVKRLEVHGFKSFKDKTVIHFDHSITGIVGPNGCGKSNIVDAFFWVMGEQSYKHMRGNGSDDLIFNGSSKYSPMGMAEATLVMETDVPADMENAPAGASAQDIPIHLRTKEISVTRRLYRSGEGEYFINGVPSRLKDIHELFMDTGIGTKGYSVIEQGQIGKIVNSKPEERRLLIEEAAGIAKYKARKKESLRKMEATQGNLSRLNDVIQEIERSLGSLERQSQKARQYKKYREELLDKEVTWGRRKSQVLRQRLENVKRQRDELDQELVGLRAELQVAENSIETDRVVQLTDTKLAEDLQTTIQTLAADLAREKSALDLSRHRQGDLATQLTTLENEKQDLGNAIEIEQEKLVTRESHLEDAEAAFQTAQAQAQAADQTVRQLRQDSDAARRKLDQDKRALMQGISQASELTSRAASLASRIESARAQAERLAEQIEAHQERVTTGREESEKARTSAEEVKLKRDTLALDRKTLQAEQQTRDQSVRLAEKARDESNRKLTQLRSRLQSLEELAAAHEGFGDGPKAALDWARSNGHSDKLKAIADALDVSSGYEAALEGWLESRLENLFSEEPSVAIEALHKIQSGKRGRAAIQLMAGESAQAIDFTSIKKTLEKSGFEVLGALTDFVSVNSKLGNSGSASALMMIASVAVVKSLQPLSDNAELQNAQTFGGWSLVTLEGQALQADGVLRGGSTESSGAGSLLGRKRAITELQTQVADAELDYQTLERAATEARFALETARERMQQIQSEFQQLEIEGAALERDVIQMARAQKEAENQLQMAEREAARMLEQAEEAQSEREEVAGRLVEITSNRADTENQIADDEAAVQNRDDEMRAREGELQALRVNEASLRERLSGLKRELEQSRVLVVDRQRRLTEVERILDRANREREEHTGGDSGLEQVIEELTRALSTNRETLSATKDRLEQSNAQLNQTLSRIKELHSVGDRKTTEANTMAIDLEKISGELAHLLQNLEEKYGPGCLDRPMTSPIQEEMTETVVTQEMSIEDELRLGEEVERLRERIRRLGEVNVMAIEEFEETQKRYDYLMTEKNDLLYSLQNLQEAIEHINKTSEERFRKAFEAIATRFERLFPIIFGGGSAKLSLVYPEGSDDILEAGVDILAQPPGKKVSNITLLSGGEKALTAVSLIFAIFMVKPSPFCLLDEVDAPLDDANIGKFNALLREMSAKSQFILITHNKKTMELNDTLYGVTMEEPGVSKMVSIEMSK